MGKCNIFISKTAKKQGILELHYRRAGACSRRKTQKYNRSTKQKVLRLTVRYIGICRTGLSAQEPAYQHHNTTNQEGNNTNPVA